MFFIFGTVLRFWRILEEIGMGGVSTRTTARCGLFFWSNENDWNFLMSDQRQSFFVGEVFGNGGGVRARGKFWGGFLRGFFDGPRRVCWENFGLNEGKFFFRRHTKVPPFGGGVWIVRSDVERWVRL